MVCLVWDSLLLREAVVSHQSMLECDVERPRAPDQQHPKHVLKLSCINENRLLPLLLQNFYPCMYEVKYEFGRQEYFFMHASLCFSKHL